MEASTQKKIWIGVGIVALIWLLIWAYRKFVNVSPSVNVPKASENIGIKYADGLNLASNETLTTVKPSDKPCPSTAGKCKNGEGTLFLTGSDSSGCHYGCYTTSAQ